MIGQTLTHYKILSEISRGGRGRIHEDRGEMDNVCEFCRRFYAYWKGGDIDRERVEEAKEKRE